MTNKEQDLLNIDVIRVALILISKKPGLLFSISDDLLESSRSNIEGELGERIATHFDEKL